MLQRRQIKKSQILLTRFRDRGPNKQSDSTHKESIKKAREAIAYIADTVK